MRVKKYKSDKLVSIPIKKYLINWAKAPSKGQQILQDFLYPYWKDCIVLKEMKIPGTKWRFDIVNCNRRIIVEFSPTSHHNKYNPFFHKSRAGYLRSLLADSKKREWAEENDFKVIDVCEEDLDYLSKSYFLNTFDVQLS